MFEGRNCSENALCKVSNDGRIILKCFCMKGFVGNGFICRGKYLIMGFYVHSYDCLDVDECNSGLDNCNTNAKCTNTIGSFDCHCKDGFVGDGKNCTSKYMIRLWHIP